MANTLDRLKQTHRTILFEEFTHPAEDKIPNLYDYLSDAADKAEDGKNIDDEIDRDIKKNLEVHSFQEFLEKFKPAVYEYATKEGYRYTDDPRIAGEKGAYRVDITDHTYYQMLVNMYSTKGESGLANIEFKEDEIKKILTPAREIDEALDIRRKMKRLGRKYEAARLNHENTDDIKSSINKLRRKIRDKYQDGASIVAMLPLAIDDANRKIMTLEEKIGVNNDGENQDAPLLLTSGRYDFGDDGKLLFIPHTSSNDEEVPTVDSNVDEEIVLLVGKDYDKFVSDSGNYKRDLVLSAYTPYPLTTTYEDKSLAALKEELEEQKKRRAYYENLYKDAKESFIHTLIETTRKILGVKIFFHHATNSSDPKAKLNGAGLIIANTNLRKLMDDKVKNEFQKFLKKYGVKETGKNKIWFSVVPGVMFEKPETSTSTKSESENISDWEELDDDIDQKEEENKSKVDISLLTNFLKLGEESRIITLFNFIPEEKNSFAGITKNYIDEVKDELNKLGYETAALCYPNFTLMKKGSVPMDYNRDNSPEIEVPTVYIDAAYPAAGLIVASQTPTVLKQYFGSKVNLSDVCCKINLEDPSIGNKILTHFNRERSTKWDDDIVNAIVGEHFGFAFSSDEKTDTVTRKKIDNSYILSARSLKKEGENYKPVYKSIFNNFVKTYLFSYGDPATDTTVKAFIGDVEAWKIDTRKSETKDKINLLLKEDESIVEYKDERGKFTIIYGKDEDVIEVDFKDE